MRTLLLCLVLTTSALAGDINFTSPILNAYGDPFLGEDGKPTSLGRILIAALGATLDRDRNESENDKAERFKLAVVIAQAERAGTPIKLTAKEITLLNDRLAKAQGNAILIGRVREMLEPPEK